MDAHQLLSNFQARGIRLIPEGTSLAVEPASQLSDADRVAIRAHKADLLTMLRAQREENESDRLGMADGSEPLLKQGHPAYSILQTCQDYGVALRIDSATGDLVVGKAGATADESTQPWPSLIMALEAHLEPVAALVRAGWTLKADLRHKPLT